MQCLLNPAVRSVARRRAAPILAALGLPSNRGDHDHIDQHDHWSWRYNIWNIVSKNLQVNIGQRRRRMNLVKVSPSVLPTVFRQLEIYPDICTNMKIQRPSSGLLTNSHPPLVPSRTLNAMLHLKFGCSYRFWGNNPIISCRFSERFPRTLTSGIQH